MLRVPTTSGRLAACLIFLFGPVSILRPASCFSVLLADQYAHRSKTGPSRRTGAESLLRQYRRVLEFDGSHGNHAPEQRFLGKVGRLSARRNGSRTAWVIASPTGSDRQQSVRFLAGQGSVEDRKSPSLENLAGSRGLISAPMHAFFV